MRVAQLCAALLLVLCTCTGMPAAAARPVRRLLQLEEADLGSLLACMTKLADTLLPCADNNPQPGDACCAAVQAALNDADCARSMEAMKAGDAQDAQTVNAV